MKRPTGVTVLAILDIAFGAIMAIGALGLVALTRLVEMNLSEFADLPSFGLLMGAIGSMLSVVLLAIAAVEFLLAWGLLGGKGWAWTATIVFSAIAIAIELLSLPFSLVGIAVNALVIYYFFRPNVKAFFGKVPAGAYEASIQPPPPPPEALQQAPACPRCGNPLTYIGQYQRWYCYNCQQYV